MPQMFEEFSVVGGAVFPLEDGGTGVTWPLVRATVTDEGIRVEGRIGRKLFSMSCMFTWGELRSVEVRQASIIPHGPNYRDLTFGNMFAPAKLKAVVDEARRRGVSITNE